MCSDVMHRDGTSCAFEHDVGLIWEVKGGGRREYRFRDCVK